MGECLYSSLVKCLCLRHPEACESNCESCGTLVIFECFGEWMRLGLGWVSWVNCSELFGQGHRCVSSLGHGIPSLGTDFYLDGQESGRSLVTQRIVIDCSFELRMKLM